MTDTNTEGNRVSQKPRPAKWRMRLLALVGSLLIVELLLQLLTLVSSTAYDTLVPGAVERHFIDPQYGRMPNPRFPGHDDWGFRNERVPDTAAVVVLGDSQAYGTGVLHESAWPAVLGTTHGFDVYGVAYGGWGQAKQLSLLPKALSLKPKVVVVALYLGNDFADCYRRVYLSDGHEELRSSDPDDIAALEQAESKSPLYRAIGAVNRKRGGVKELLLDLSTKIRLLGIARKVVSGVRAIQKHAGHGDIHDGHPQRLLRAFLIRHEQGA